MLGAALWQEGAAINHPGEGSGDCPEFSGMEIRSLSPSFFLRQHHSSVSCSNACIAIPLSLSGSFWHLNSPIKFDFSVWCRKARNVLEDFLGCGKRGQGKE